MAENEDKRDAGAAPRGAGTGASNPVPGGAPRIGVFICSCGQELVKALDISDVEAHCRKLAGVVFAGVEPYPCSRPGLAGVREVIAANSLNRVVIAGCTPRLHGRLFADACERAGVNRWLVEFANIREHCGRVHGDRAKATEKAKDLINGAVIKVGRAKPLESIKVSPLNSVLVVGGGISGLTAAAKLVQLGHEVTLIEKEGALGGNLARVPNVYPFARSGSDVVRKAVAAIDGKVEVLTSTTVGSLRGGPGRYAVTLGPAGGVGDAAGGVENAATGGNVGDGKDSTSGGAVRSFGAIVVAAGGDWVRIKDVLSAIQKYDPTACPAHGDYLRAAAEFYGKLPAFTGRVLTQAELEAELAAGTLKSVRSALFVNLSPGSQSNTRLNSLVALKNAISLRHSSPETDVTFVFDRIPSEYERDFRRARDHGVKFVRQDGVEPPDFTLKGLRVKTVSPSAGGAAPSGSPDAVNLEADLVVTPTLSTPSAETVALAGVLRIPMDSNGLLVEPHVKLRPGDFAQRAIFVIGACHGPVTVFECLAQAGDAAARATEFLHGEIIRAPFVSDIDERVCRGCGRCAEACEWDAIEMTALENGLKLAVVDESMCTGCGVCAMVCICGAPVLAPVRREQVGATVEAMLQGR